MSPMKILVVSDTHGQQKEIREVIRREKPFDGLIHCGDVEGQEKEIAEYAGVPCIFVRGNNDFYGDLPTEAVIYRLGHRIFVAHGHRHSVSWNMDSIKSEAKARGCDMVLYGHTHIPVIDTSDPEMTVMNPGSLAYPRQTGRAPSYIVMERDEEENVTFEIRYLKPRAARRRLW